MSIFLPFFNLRNLLYLIIKVTEEHKDNAKLKSSATTQLVSQIVLSGGRTISYEYDEEERITKIDDSVDGITTYTYDALGQLLTETVNGTAVNTMTYDNYGNIRTKNGIKYTYGDENWKDLLTGVGEQSITYDAQGNPVSYLGHTLTWEKGRQLKSFDNNTYIYNANGIRTSKTVDGIRHDYVLDGAKILREAWNYNANTSKYADVLTPLYDNEESVCGIVYNNIPYYFIKNLQGDVIAIVDKDAETVARYTYDAWGVCTVTQDNSGANIANINPFRYRGYVYDQEIGLYYLQSRYYDPVVGRFLNTDKVEITTSDRYSSQYNMYIYVYNNPINELDEYGCSAFQFLAFGIQIAISIGFVNLGLEFLWDLKNGRFYPFLYFGGGYSYGKTNGINYVEKYILNPLKKIKKTPGAILKLFTKLSISVSAIIVFGNSKQKMPTDYCGFFTGFSFGIKVFCLNLAISGAFARNQKGYIASLGVGLSSSLSIDLGQTYYIYLNSKNGIVKQLKDFVDKLKSNANKVKNTLLTATRVMF